MKTPFVVVVIVAVVVGLVFLIRSRIVPTRSATVAEIPPIFAKLATLKDGSFAVFMFDSPLSRGGDAVNLQYSVEHGTVGLDWVLLGSTNIADKEKVAAFAAQLGPFIRARHEQSALSQSRGQRPRSIWDEYHRGAVWRPSGGAA